MAQYIPWAPSVEVSKFSDSNELCEVQQTRNDEDRFEPDVDLSSSLMNPEQRQQMRNLVNELSQCFVDPSNNRIGVTDLLTHKIETYPGSKPVYRQPYRVSPEKRRQMDEIVEEQLSQGIIERVYDGDYASPALLVKKSSGAMRLVIDYR